MPTVSLLWQNPGATGRVQIDRGTITATAPALAPDGAFTLAAGRPARIDLAIASTHPAVGLPTLVTVATAPRGFAFRLADVSADHPVWLPGDGVVVTTGADTRDYAAIVAAIQARGSRTALQRTAAAPETSFATAAAGARSPRLQTWLGLSRDLRVFRVDERLETFQPKFAGYDVPLPETPAQPATWAFQCGRGWGARDAITRSLDDGELPVLRAAVDDGPVRYELTLFASPERSPLDAATLRGTDYLVADAHGHGHMFTPAQAEEEKRRAPAEMDPPEEVVLCARVTATNRGDEPVHAFFRTVTPALATPISPKLPPWTYDAATGCGAFASSGRVFAVSRLDGAPLPAEEISPLLAPGRSLTCEFFVPHRPLSRDRALALPARSFDTRLAEARAFWRAKLAAAAQVRLPEPRIQAMVRAGLLHLDLVAYGREPDQPLLPAIGIYTAIGSESAPIIQFFDSMGRPDLAARALDFFLAKQHDDGFIQNFNHYMLETGAVLWSLGEHYRCTRDDAWRRRVHPHVTRAWHYLRDWRRRNLQPELKGDGYGLLDGKTADPDDPYRSYMLNGYAYLGLARAAGLLRDLAPAEAAECQAEADALRADIRASFIAQLERAPVVPLGDGAWARAAAPWTGYRGPVMLHADGGSWFTHGTMTARDSLLGPLWLVLQEVLAPDEPLATELLATQSALALRDGVAFSQPYYSPHPWVHLRRGEIKSFLQAWYGTVAALADRETFTFNEHFFPVSAHKTHEEAWFLMQTRWLLYLEDGDTLRLLAGAPRAWLAAGAVIAVDGAASYFGPLSFHVEAAADGRSVRATVDCPAERRPRRVVLRLPHPDGHRATAATGCRYDASTETVTIDDFTGHAQVELSFKA